LSGAAPRIRHYTYTEAGQLQSAGDETPDGQTVNTVTWGYDANGNRVTENNQTIAQYDEQDRLLRWKDNTYRYTPAGDLQERQSPEGRSRYHYDAQGNLRRVETESGRTIEYAIDPLNRRIGQQIDGQWQWWLLWLDKLRPLARLDAQGQLESIYYYGDHANVPEGLRKNGQDYRIITDQIGSVRLVVNTETGEEMQRIDYDEWGQITLDTNPGFQPFGFAGGLYDPDTGLTRFGARDYDAQTGRWTAKDPILFEGGEVGLYGYVGGSPLNYIDPMGVFKIPLVDDFYTGKEIACLEDQKQQWATWLSQTYSVPVSQWSPSQWYIAQNASKQIAQIAVQQASLIGGAVGAEIVKPSMKPIPKTTIAMGAGMLCGCK
ncbi:MAG: RHS repeat-associated core domain-containing protein, partial [Curvibacter sp.]|nr:RHS repeat-associated core domain-containing protein [Curvibacter sp.]